MKRRLAPQWSPAQPYGEMMASSSTDIVRKDAGLAATAAARLPARFPRWPVSLFLLTLIIPVFFWVGPFRLSPYRIFLLISIVPLLVGLLIGRCGRILTGDILMLAFASWIAVGVLYNHGVAGIEFAGITFVETVGPYLLARRFMRSADDLAATGRALRVLVLVLLPAAILEALDITRLYADILANFALTFDPSTEFRIGLVRAQANFEHPILFGVFVASTYALIAAIPNTKNGRAKGLGAAWITIPSTFLSLSVGAYLVLVTQFALISWNIIFSWLRARWKILIATFIAGYVVVDLLSTRTPFEVFISYMTFNPDSAYWRIHIWNFGMENVRANPLFGIGLNDWVRPAWMYTASVDNFWLLNAMRYGIPAFVLAALVYFYAVFTVSLRARKGEVDNPQRRALVFTLVSVGVGICTVHLWGSTYSYFMFLLGAGLYVASDPEPEADSTACKAGDGTSGTLARATRTRHLKPRYSRFAQKD